MGEHVRRLTAGVAALNVVGGVVYGTLATVNVRPAVGQVVRNDRPAISRLPVAVVRPIWGRLNLTGTHDAEMPRPPVPTDAPTHGAGCADCVR